MDTYPVDQIEDWIRRLEKVAERAPATIGYEQIEALFGVSRYTVLRMERAAGPKRIKGIPGARFRLADWLAIYRGDSDAARREPIETTRAASPKRTARR